MLHAYDGVKPQVSDKVFIAPGAQVVGRVQLKEGANVWFNAVIRGDLDIATIGKKTNIQDGVLCHVDDNAPLTVGDYVTVGHGAILHGCTIGDECLIGMGATILNNATIGDQSIIAAGALIPEGAEIPPRSLVMGVPGKVVRELSEEEVSRMREGPENYYKKAEKYGKTLKDQG